MFNVICKVAIYRIGSMIEKIRVLGIKIKAFFELILPFIVGALVLLGMYGVMFLALIAAGCPY